MSSLPDMWTNSFDCTCPDSKQRIQDVLWNAGSQIWGRRSSQIPISDRWRIYKNSVEFLARFPRSSPRLDYRPQRVTCCNILCQISDGNSTLHRSSCVWQKTPCEIDKLYCKTQSPLSLGILASAMTFCTWSASFSALKRTKQTNKIVKKTLAKGTKRRTQSPEGLTLEISAPFYRFKR